MGGRKRKLWACAPEYILPHTASAWRTGTIRCGGCQRRHIGRWIVEVVLRIEVLVALRLLAEVFVKR